MDAAQIAGSEGRSEALELSARDREILAFERQWWKYAGAKEQAVRDLFDMSATRYYQVLNTLSTHRRRSRATRCWSSGCAGCGPPASAPARPAASASSSENRASRVRRLTSCSDHVQISGRPR